MRETLAVLREGRTITASPALICPATISPVKPRNLELGLLTHCTGIRKEDTAGGRLTSIRSRYSKRLNPPYHGVFLDRDVMLSPLSAESGIAVIVSNPSSVDIV